MGFVLAGVRLVLDSVGSVLDPVFGFALSFVLGFDLDLVLVKVGVVFRFVLGSALRLFWMLPGWRRYWLVQIFVKVFFRDMC